MKNINWNNIINVVFSILTALALGFGIYSGINAAKEEERRVAAQNELARQAEVIKEKENIWSKLSLQQENIIDHLIEKNEELGLLINSRDEQILTLTETIATIRPTTIIVREENVDQDEPEEGRTRVSFDQTEDPIRVEGFTLTNPPEAEMEVSFVRPLRLTTVVTQQESGQWTTYFESDWDNLEIQEAQTFVNPLEARIRPRLWYENISIGTNLGISGFSGLQGDIFVTYDIGKFSVGPSLGISVSDEDSFANVGIVLQYRPFLETN